MKINAVDYVKYLIENIDEFEVNCTPLWHPLGFVSCLIAEVNENYKLRVHYWPSGERRTKNPNWPIHTHSYTLSSLVLSGCVRDTQYRLAKGGDYQVYKVEYFDGGSHIIKTDQSVSLVESINKTHKAGNQYRVERGMFHQSLVDFNESAVTFVALSEDAKEPPLVLGESAADRYPYDRAPFDSRVFWAAVKSAVSACGSSWQSHST